MANWSEFVAAEPELSAVVHARLKAVANHALATLRQDGSPRISATEVDVWGDDLVLGSMAWAVKARDLQRDGRYAVHATPLDPSVGGGDIKLAGVAVEITDPAELAAFTAEREPPEPYQLFRLGVGEVTVTTVDEPAERMDIVLWTPHRGVRRFERYIKEPAIEVTP